MDFVVNFTFKQGNIDWLDIYEYINKEYVLVPSERITKTGNKYSFSNSQSGVYFFKFQIKDIFLNTVSFVEKECIYDTLNPSGGYVTINQEPTFYDPNNLGKSDRLVSALNDSRNEKTMEMVLSLISSGVNYTVTNQLTNCTSNINDNSSFAENTTVEVEVTPNSGYYFAVDGKVVDESENTIISLTKNTTGNKLTGSFTITKNSIIKAVAVEQETPTYTVTTKLTNCTCNINNGAIYEENETINVIVTPNSGYYFESDGFVNNSIGITIATLESNSDGSKLTGSFVITDDSKIVATAVSKEEPPTPTDKVTVNTNISNATCNIINGTQYDKDSLLTVIVTLNEGFYFPNDPYISIYLLGTYDNTILETTDNKNYTATVTLTGNATIYANALPSPTTETTGLLTIYNPTNNELNSFANERFLGDIDLGEYISKLIKLYVNVPQNTKGKIILGGYTTDVYSNVLTDNIIVTDCGEIEIKEHFHNAMDYQNTTAEIYLPFIGFQNLDIEKIMNKTISLTYKTNVLNGDTLAFIKENENILYTFSSNCSYEIPYRVNMTDYQGILSPNASYLYGFIPFLRLMYNKEYDTELLFTNDDRVTFIKNETGLIKCSEVFNTVDCTLAEKEKIEMLLKGGIIV